MGHLENKIEWCLNKAKKEGSKHRGLKEVSLDDEKSNKHIEKANHNLKAMLYMIEGNFLDWAVSCSFYSMYHCLLAILAKYGYESRNQECTFVAIEYLIKNKKIELDMQLIKKIASFEDNLESEDVLNLREKFQYGTEAAVDDAKINELVRDTKEFVIIVREIIQRGS